MDAFAEVDDFQEALEKLLKKTLELRFGKIFKEE